MCEWQILCEIVISNVYLTIGVALYVVDALHTTVVRTRKCNLAGYLSRLAWMRSWSSSYFSILRASNRIICGTRKFKNSSGICAPV